MPEITRFYGIIIKMHFIESEHNPPHLHAIYGEYFGEINLTTLKMTEGDLPLKAQKLVIEWVREHKDELIKMWKTQRFKRIKPLE